MQPHDRSLQEHHQAVATPGELSGETGPHRLERCRIFARRAILCLSDALELRIAQWRYGIAHELQRR